ncbi:thermonuclease family protein [Bartonella sp. DGB2]|uniref:thermonuclease family protein n=1 Tax=Bartonella sp. DGB2 TaxID=3388426 RepID=UPI00398FCFAB
MRMPLKFLQLLYRLRPRGKRQNGYMPSSQEVALYGAFIALAILGTALYEWYNYKAPSTHNSFPQTLIGKPYITDGDSITLDRQKIRLLGIDAPELHQMCQDNKGNDHPCGLWAKEYLVKLINNQIVTCTSIKRDKYRRLLATCQTNSIADLNREMIRAGFAVSYYSYKTEEKEARQQKRGIWRLHFETPQDWRKKHRWAPKVNKDKPNKDDQKSQSR